MLISSLVDPRLVGTRKLRFLKLKHVTSQSEEGPWADHASYDPLLPEAIQEFRSFEHELPILLAWCPANKPIPCFKHLWSEFGFLCQRHTSNTVNAFLFHLNFWVVLWVDRMDKRWLLLPWSEGKATPAICMLISFYWQLFSSFNSQSQHRHLCLRHCHANSPHLCPFLSRVQQCTEKVTLTKKQLSFCICVCCFEKGGGLGKE